MGKRLLVMSKTGRQSIHPYSYLQRRNVVDDVHVDVLERQWHGEGDKYGANGPSHDVSLELIPASLARSDNPEKKLMKTGSSSRIAWL